MTDDKLLIDEEQRAVNYEAVKSAVKADAAREIAARANQRTPPDAGVIADDLRTRAVEEIADTQADVDRGRAAARVSQIVDYVFFLIYGLLAVRLLLELFAAREGVAFFRFIKTLTDPIYWPFQGLVPSPSTPDGFSLELPIIVALFVYALLHMAINGIMRIIAHRKVAV